jgi:hypothetical protein
MLIINPSTWEAEAGGSLVWGQPGLAKNNSCVPSQNKESGNSTLYFGSTHNICQWPITYCQKYEECLQTYF